MKKTVDIAQNAFKSGAWSKASRHTRADVLDKAAEILTQELPNLIPLEVRQTGRPIREMQAQVPSLVRWFKYYASVLRTEERPVLPTIGKLHNWLDRIPLGVVVQITPFNHPLLIAVKKLAPALAAGNSVILKPSELTPLTSLLLGPILQRAGIPDGVFNVLPGTGVVTGKALVSHPLVRKVDVTGGTEAGKAIGTIVGGNLARYTAELGGKAPVLVFEEADLDAAANGIAFGGFVASGQTCVAATRVIVHNKVMPALLNRLKLKAESIRRRMGAPSNPESMMGPIISAHQLTKAMSLVRSSEWSGKAEIIYGGQQMLGNSELDGIDFAQGHFYPPTIMVPPTGSDANMGSGNKRTAKITDSDIWREEAFAPVLAIVGFDTEEEALALANDTQYGLGAAVWTKDLSQAHRISEAIQAGIVWVNTHHRNDPSSPWGGATSASGVGSENGIEAYHAYTTTKSTIINFASTEESLAQEDWFREGGQQVRYG